MSFGPLLVSQEFERFIKLRAFDALIRGAKCDN